MAFTVANGMTYARSFLKVPSTYASAEEVRMANLVQTEVTGFHNWHWAITAGTDVAVSSGTAEYTIDAADQNKVKAIMEANLLEGATEQDELLIWSDPPVPKTSTSGQPIAVSLISPTKVRLWPLPDATYTFQWQYYKRPVIFTANSENWDIPEAFTSIVKVGMLWQLMEFKDDTRATEKKNDFFALLANHKRIELMTMGKSKN